MFTKSEGRHKAELRHECELPPEEDIVVKYICTGCFVQTRRAIKKTMLLNETSPITKAILKSSTLVKTERLFHLKYHYYMIHPFSTFRFTWTCFMIFVFEIMISLNCTLRILQNAPFLVTAMTVADGFCFINIIINFNTGYLSLKTNRMIFSRKMVARNYLLEFVIDLIGALSIQLAYKQVEGNIFKAENRIFLRKVETLMYLKFCVIIPQMIYIMRVREYKQYNIYKFRVITILAYAKLAIVAGTFVMLSIRIRNSAKFYENSTLSKRQFLLDSFIDVLRMLLLIVTPQESLDSESAVIEMVLLILGVVLQLAVVSQIMLFVTKHNSTFRKFYAMHRQIQEYIHYKFLPGSLRQKIKTYFDFRFEQCFYNERELYSALSPQLKQEFLVHTYMNLLEKVHLFEDLPMTIVCKVINSMRYEIYLPADVIVIAGTYGDCMYFLTTGTVAVYSIAGKEICHLSDGANFGEVSLILENEQRVASVVALECCEVYILHRKDFLHHITRYPEIYLRLKRQAFDRAKKAAMTESDEDPTF